MPLYEPSAVFARGISARAFTPSLIQTRNSKQQLAGMGVHYGSVIVRGNFRTIQGWSRSERPGQRAQDYATSTRTRTRFRSTVRGSGFVLPRPGGVRLRPPSRLSFSSKRRPLYCLGFGRYLVCPAERPPLRIRRLRQGIATTPPVLEDTLRSRGSRSRPEKAHLRDPSFPAGG
jgi:hypothetical protein